MEQIFNGLKAVSGEPQLVILTEKCIPELFGSFTLTKGAFKQTFSYWSKIYKHDTIKGVVYQDDGDYDLKETRIGDCLIDSISAFKATLKNSGMSTVADSLDFTFEEVNNAIAQAIQKHKKLNSFFGEEVRLRNLISKEEWVKILLVDVIENYDNRSISEKNNHLFEIVTDETETVTTKEQLIERLNILSKD